MTSNILALDTSTEACSVALLYQGKYYQSSEVCPRGHATKILPMVDQILGNAGIKLNQLDALAVGRGPGSFTGIRCSITFAKMMRISLSIPIYGYTKFELANFFLKPELKNKNIKKRIFLHYQGEEFFHSSYRMDKCISKPEIFNLSEYNLNNYKNDLLISDNKLFFDYLKNEKNTQNPEMFSIFKYKLENILDLNKQYFQKKYIPQPIYVKNLF